MVAAMGDEARGSSLRTELVSSERVLVLEGELDVATVAQLDDALANAVANTSGTLTVDASRISFLDSVGLRSILNVTAALSDIGRAVAIVCSPGPVRRLIELTALTGHLALYDTRAAAIAGARSDDAPRAMWAPGSTRGVAPAP
jgi:anti-sigma B factor antagonist